MGSAEHRALATRLGAAPAGRDAVAAGRGKAGVPAADQPFMMSDMTPFWACMRFSAWS
jgi:hypothetical protein